MGGASTDAEKFWAGHVLSTIDKSQEKWRHEIEVTGLTTRYFAHILSAVFHVRETLSLKLYF